MTAPHISLRRLRPIRLGIGIGLFFVASHHSLMADETLPTPEKEEAKKPLKVTKNPELKDERPPGGDGSMFFTVFVSRNDKNGDGVVEKSEFRGGEARFDQMDKNKNGKLDRSEIDELHRSRMADPLSMRQRIERGETRRPPIDLPSETGSKPKAGDDADPNDEPSALTPLGTRITAKQAYARLDGDKNGKVTATEFQKSPGMSDPEKAKQTVAKVDSNGDGTLSFDEFNAVFAKRHAKQPGAKAKRETAQSLPK